MSLFLFFYTLYSIAQPSEQGPGPWISTANQTHLIELFSSEGCSSCPPADSWVTSLREKKGLWTAFVPIEFHVDYWNRLGWTDRFSRTVFTDRQNQYAQEWGKQSVYTPGFVLDGREWRPSSASNRLDAVVNSAGVLSVKKSGPYSYTVEFAPVGPMNHVRVYGAFLGNGLESKVASGENAGKVLRHDFVVLSLRQSEMTRDSNRFTGEIEFKAPSSEKAKGYSVAFWVTDGKTQTPLQAVGGDL